MTIIVNHDYTTGADANIDAYTEDGFTYIYNLGSGSNIVVSAANDRAQPAAALGDLAARLSGAGLPTGDQEIIATLQADSNGSTTVNARCATSGNLGNWYSIYVDIGVANESQLYRFDNGAFNLIDDADLFNGAGSRTARLRVTGAGATVTCEWQINATTTQTFADTAATRKTSGVPGIGAYTLTAAAVWIDNLTVDDLVAAGGVVPVLLHHDRARWAA